MFKPASLYVTRRFSSRSLCWALFSVYVLTGFSPPRQLLKAHKLWPIFPPGLLGHGRTLRNQTSKKPKPEPLWQVLMIWLWPNQRVLDQVRQKSPNLPATRTLSRLWQVLVIWLWPNQRVLDQDSRNGKPFTPDKAQTWLTISPTSNLLSSNW